MTDGVNAREEKELSHLAELNSPQEAVVIDSIMITRAPSRCLICSLSTKLDFHREINERLRNIFVNVIGEEKKLPELCKQYYSLRTDCTKHVTEGARCHGEVKREIRVINFSWNFLESILADAKVAIQRMFVELNKAKRIIDANCELFPILNDASLSYKDTSFPFFNGTSESFS